MRRFVDIREFRYFDKKYVLIVNANDRAWLMVRAAGFQVRPDDNAILTFAYIDHDAGISFSVMAAAKVYPDGRVAIGLSNQNTGLLLRQDSFEGRFLPYDEMEYLIPFERRADTIRNNYNYGQGVQEVRDIREIDGIRAPGYPDDLMVHFFKQGVQPEGIWCRVTGTNHENYHIVGKLINEPYANLGVHSGDTVEFILYNSDETGVMALKEL